jgi:hypothetical protein
VNEEDDDTSPQSAAFAAAPHCVNLRHCPSLRELNISDTAVTAAGSMGLDEIGTLQCLKARGRTQLDASTLPLSIIARGGPKQLRGD